MANGAQACNVLWTVDAAVTLSTSTLPPLFQGNILAGDPIGGSITITGGALVGRAFANVAVTMTGTNINGVCALVDKAEAARLTTMIVIRTNRPRPDRQRNTIMTRTKTIKTTTIKTDDPKD